MTDKIENLRRNTAKYRLLPTVALALRNMQTLSNKKAALLCKPGRGAAVVVSAGPSLDAVVDELKRQRGRALIIAVNTAVKALHRAGIVPDVIVSTEHVDVSAHMDVEGTDTIVTCLGSAHAVWERATHWVADPQPYTFRLSQALGVKPLWCCGNVAPTAISLALEWGADPCIIVGQDLAYAASGQVYATGAPWDGTRVEFDGDSLKFAHLEERQQAHLSAGVPAIPDKHEAITIPGWGGGEVKTTTDWTLQLDLIEQLAGCYADRRLVNATGGGAHIDGWQETRLTDVDWGAEALTVPECGTVPLERVDAANAVIAAEMEAATAIARDELENDGRGDEWLRSAKGLPIATALCTPDWLMLSDLKGMAPRAGIDARYSVWQAAPRWVDAVLAGTREVTADE